ncbi:hypothetical protein LPY66_04660 [Dehalobacter sp. DCM]|uniref:hypothetical protein n=1 Tax=Dehalobacter sp. DCM TaxID=2907827 RepID=UPI003081E38C|nr:hypothetical protein LPY66_04660 [Dehalobacter sp. DCM]
MDLGHTTRNDIYGKTRRFLFLIFLLPCMANSLREIDNDFWFILNHGRYVLEHGFPTIEPFSIHAGLSFVMQQWLTAVIFQLIYTALGTVGIKLLVFVCYVISISVFYKLCMRLSRNFFFLSYLLTIAFSLLISFFMVERPFVLMTLILLVEIYALEAYAENADKNNARRLIIALPILSILLVSIQASMWLMLFVLLLPYVIGSFRFKIGAVYGETLPKKPIVITVVLMAAAGFVNPYGGDAMTYLLRSYGVDEINSLVAEMYPTTVTSGLGMIMFGMIVVIFLAFVLYRNDRMPVRYVLLVLGTAYLGLSSYRGFIFFIICGIFPLAAHYRDFKIPELSGNSSPRTLKIRKILIALVGCALICLVIAGGSQYKNLASTPGNSELLNAAVAVVKQDQEQGNVILYTGYNDGNLAEYNGIRAYLDTRAEVFIKNNNHKEDILKEYYELQTGRLHYKTFLEKYHFTHLILNKNSTELLRTYVAHDPEYVMIYANDSYEVYRLKAYKGGI